MSIKEENFNRAKRSFSDRSVSDVEKKVVLSEIYSSGEEMSVASFFWGRKVFIAFAALLLLISGGTTYAATQSLPGEPLYGIKVNIVEPIGMALRIGEEARANYQLSLMDKRIKELETLEREGRSSDKAERQSSSAMLKNISNLEVVVDLDSSLDISSRIEAYNSLISEEFNMESNLIIDTEVIIDAPINVEIGSGPLDDEEAEEDPHYDNKEDEDILTPELPKLPEVPTLDIETEIDIMEEL